MRVETGRPMRSLAIGAGLLATIAAPAAAQEVPSAEAIAAAVQEQITSSGIAIGGGGSTITVGETVETGGDMGMVTADGGTSLATGDAPGDGAGAVAVDD